jgi:hypothetical protein
MFLDSGMVVVILISMMYIVLVFGLLFYVKNKWCDLLLKNFTVILVVDSAYCKTDLEIVVDPGSPTPSDKLGWQKLFDHFYAIMS